MSNLSKYTVMDILDSKIEGFDENIKYFIGETCTLDKAIETMEEKNTDVLYVVGKEFKYIGCVYLNDIKEKE